MHIYFITFNFRRALDLSFNRISAIEGIDALVSLQKLYLCANKISVIEGISNLTNLTMLELGDNKIRVSENNIFFLN